MPREFKGVAKIKITENEIWFKICKVLFCQEISCASLIAEEIDCDSKKVASQLNRLNDSKIIEPTDRITMNYLFKHRNGNFGQFYLLTETAEKAMEEILKEQKNKRLIQ